ncbi:hypothetical protein CDD82_2968 [Ophiocordyceps australis]|uniref:Cyanovirin-N domain-containing protein n=1 Tax=Ophiocordyceps australis TaxID=1399860 RepID=A0A2C5ZC26_9HYPO|nr:hypothetical protein CDD82_2968 [Ophiocordyceps australis]
MRGTHISLPKLQLAAAAYVAFTTTCQALPLDRNSEIVCKTSSHGADATRDCNVLARSNPDQVTVGTSTGEIDTLDHQDIHPGLDDTKIIRRNGFGIRCYECQSHNNTDDDDDDDEEEEDERGHGG